MVVKYVWSRKRISWTNGQNLWKLKLFKVYGYLFYYSPEALLNLLCVFELVSSVVNFISSYKLNHYQFHEFLPEMEAEYSNFPYHKAM